MSKITNDGLTRSGAGRFTSCTHMATVGVTWLKLRFGLISWNFATTFSSGKTMMEPRDMFSRFGDADPQLTGCEYSAVTASLTPALVGGLSVVTYIVMPSTPRHRAIHMVDLDDRRTERLLEASFARTSAGRSRIPGNGASSPRSRGGRIPHLEQLGRGGRRAAAAGSEQPRTAARLRDGGAKLCVDDQIEDEVEGEVCRL